MAPLFSTAPTAQVRKRSGTLVDYNHQKIVQAVRLCLVSGCRRPDNDETKALAGKVADRVEKILKKLHGPIEVETVQDLTEQALMALKEHEAAREYIIYREEHRKLRETAQADPKAATAFEAGYACFKGANRELQMIQAIDKFARFREDLGGRREVWPESCDRVTDFFHSEIAVQRGMPVPPETWEWLRNGLMAHEAGPSMRAVQLGGPALARCNAGVNNCSYLWMDGPDALAEDLYLLMQGCGVGFSVERAAVENWPRVHTPRGGAPVKLVVDDSTEGWCDTVKTAVNIWLDGGDVDVDTANVRKEGTPLKTKGGYASGPGPLKNLLSFARNKILSRAGGCLSTLDIHDITCYAHRIVQVGGVRRASGISLSDLDDELMRECKSGNFYATDPQRNQANNSAIYNGRPAFKQFMAEWYALVRGGTGERGIINRAGALANMPQRRLAGLSAEDKRRIGVNPCAEILELDREFCNLSISVIRPSDTVAQIEQKLRQATYWGTMQSAMTRYQYISDTWRKNVERERLLGVDMLGFLDHPLLGPRANRGELAKLLEYLKGTVIAANVECARMLGINPSAAVTCNKPSGDSSVFFDTAAGFKAHHGQYWIRRLRFQPTNPLARLLKDSGVPHHVDYDNSGLLVFEFPCRAPVDNPMLLDGWPALDQLEYWKAYKQHWTEHSPSCTIYVRDSEWLAVGQWVWDNFDLITGLSFFPLDDHKYTLAPYETIDAAEYQQRRAALPAIEWARLPRYEIRDTTELRQHVACAGNSCTI